MNEPSSSYCHFIFDCEIYSDNALRLLVKDSWALQSSFWRVDRNPSEWAISDWKNLDGLKQLSKTFQNKLHFPDNYLYTAILWPRKFICLKESLA